MADRPFTLWASYYYYHYNYTIYNLVTDNILYYYLITRITARLTLQRASNILIIILLLHYQPIEIYSNPRHEIYIFRD